VFSLSPGVSTVSLVLDSLPLLAGAYTFNVSLFGRGENDFCHRILSAVEFAIVSGERWGPGDRGLLEIPSRWRLAASRDR
jgi:hypothetical protein